MCTGSETKLSECEHLGIGSHNCGHREDAGVICESKNRFVQYIDTTECVFAHLLICPPFIFLSAASTVRLVNSGNRCSGRVEIFHAGQWGTVCDDRWDLDNANVVCRQLDCGRAQSASSSAAFGAGSGTIWLDDVHCSGNESSILDCRHSGFGVHNCGHHEDAGIICEGKYRFEQLEIPQSLLWLTYSSVFLSFPVSCFTRETCQLWKPLLRQSGDLPCWTVGDSV
uniref:SRCR domain-containing protein n=1 Tax=Salarias fasciatus TaxID=181472 RepID=A0A672HD69_SALFA